MPDSKITALASTGTGTDPANDPLVIVDVSDTSMAATGTTKKVTLNQLLACSPTATLASATITGDLTVRTTGLVVNATGTGVQVSPSAPLCVKTRNSDSVGLRVLQSTGGTSGIQFTDDPVTADWGSVLATSANLFVRSNSLLQLQTGGATERFAISSTGICTWSNVGGVAGTAMTLNSTGLAIGDTAFSGTRLTLRETATNPNALAMTNRNATQTWRIGVDVSAVDDKILGFYDSTSTTFRMQLTDTGNVGIGVTPSAWSTFKAIDIGTGSSISGASSTTALGFNNYWNGSNYIYKLTAAAGDYRQTALGHAWYTAPSGTAGNAITFTQAMTLDASGNLLVGTTGTSWQTVAGFYYFAGSSLNITRSANPSLLLNRLTSDGVIVDFRRSSSAVGDISVTTTGTTYNSASDYRLKESVAPLVGGLARVSALKPSIYKWKSNGVSGEGFLAHELAEVVPAAVTGEKDAVNEDGSIKSQSIDMSRVVPILVAAIQELTAEVNALKKA